MIRNPAAAEPAIPDDVHPADVRRSSAWDISNAPRNYISLVIAHAGTALFSFASVWLIIQSLGPEGYGGILAFVAASQLAQIFLNWSLTALAKFGIEEFVETGRITKSFWSRSLILLPNLVLMLGLSSLWLPPIGRWLNIPGSVLILVAAHLAATAVWLHIQYALQGAKMLRLQGIMLTVERALTLGGVLFLSIGHQISLENALWCYILPPLMLAVAGTFILKSYIDLRPSFNRIHFRNVLVYSLPLIPFAIVGYLATTQLDAFFITHYLSTRDLGVYGVAAQVNGMILQLPILANTVLLSMFVSLKSSGQESLLQQFFKQAVPTFTLLWSAACVGLSVTAVFLLPLAFGEEFLLASTLLWILAASSVTSFPILLGFATLSNAYSRTDISMYASLGTAFTNVLFNLILIPKYGVAGCALATMLSAIVSLTIFYTLLRKAGLIGSNWVFASITPMALSAFAVAIGSGIAAALVIFVLLAFFVAYFNVDSLKYTVRAVRGRLNVEDVSPGSSLG